MTETIPPTSPTPTRGVPRRVVLAAVPVAAAAVGVGIAACGSDDSAADDTASAGSPTPGSDTASSGSKALAKTSDVPVGGATVVDDVVVTQAKAGEFAAFSTRCPHMGCSVAPQGKSLDCPCHGSEFALDGSLVKGPATSGLTPVAVKVEGTDIVRS